MRFLPHLVVVSCAAQVSIGSPETYERIVALSLEKLLCCEVCSRPLGPDDPPLLWPESYPMCLECTIEMEEDLHEENCLTAA